MKSEFRKQVYFNVVHLSFGAGSASSKHFGALAGHQNGRWSLLGDIQSHILSLNKVYKLSI